MSPLTKSHIFSSLIILLIASVFRMYDFTYGYESICLTPPQEAWLYDTVQVISPYTALTQPQVTVEVVGGASHYFPNNSQFIIIRYLSAIISLLTIAFTLRTAHFLRTNWGWIAALFIAVSPYFVWVDRWLIAYDLAHVAISMSIYAIFVLSVKPQHKIWSSVQHISALSLFVIAPSLWWISIGLLLAAPVRDWRVIVFIILTLILVFPPLQSIFTYAQSVNRWDGGATVACLLSGIMVMLYLWRNMSTLHRLLLASIVFAFGAATTLSLIQLPQPTEKQWDLIYTLQDIVPDNALVDLDGEIWGLRSVIVCEHRASLHIMTRPSELHQLTINPVSERYDMLADIVVYTENNVPPESFPYLYDLGDYYIGRRVDVPNPTAIPIGEQMQLIGYELSSYVDSTGQILDIRLDLQMTGAMNVHVLSYALFIQISSLSDPDTQIVNYNLPFAQELQLLVPRAYNLNRHYRVPIPSEIADGSYTVTLGFYNMFDPSNVYYRQSLGVIRLPIQPTR